MKYTIQLSQGHEAIVDYETYVFLFVYNWHYLKAPKDKHGYAVCSTPPFRNKKMHRIVLDAKKGEIVDHINRNTLDNRKENLRIVDKYVSANNKNYGKYRGVTKSGKKFIGRVTYKGKRIYLGTFKTKKYALEAVNLKRIKLNEV